MKAYIVNHPDTKDPYTVSIKGRHGDLEVIPLFFSPRYAEPNIGIIRAHDFAAIHVGETEPFEVSLVDINLSDIIEGKKIASD